VSSKRGRCTYDRHCYSVEFISWAAGGVWDAFKCDDGLKHEITTEYFPVVFAAPAKWTNDNVRSPRISLLSFRKPVCSGVRIKV
jgi:hypothetical protein